MTEQTAQLLIGKLDTVINILSRTNITLYVLLLITVFSKVFSKVGTLRRTKPNEKSNDA